MPRSHVEELRRIRAELDHLVSVRFSAGLTPAEREQYERLAQREAELLSVAARSKALATSS